MNFRNNFSIVFLILPLLSFGQLADKLSINATSNAVADDIIISLELEIDRTILYWKQGEAYIGLSTFYGLSIIGEDNIQIEDSKTTYWQYIQGIVGHQFLFFKKRLSFKSSVKFGPSNFKQKAKLIDNSLDIDKDYNFSKTKFTSHVQLGVGYRIGKTWRLEALGNLPVSKNNKLTPLGIGLGVSVKL